MDYPKFCFTKDEKELFVALILQIAKMVKIRKTVHIIKEDPDDDTILETAIEGGVNYLVTGDPHLLKLKEFAGVRIVTPDEFLRSTQQGNACLYEQ